MAKTNTKKHKCKKCELSHIGDIGTHMCSSYTYINQGGNIYIDAFSVFDMLNNMGLSQQAMRFMKSISEVRKRKSQE